MNGVRVFRGVVLAMSAALAASAIGAQSTTPFGETNLKGSQLGDELTQRFEVGVVVTASGGPCRGIVAMVPVPIDWPEQTVKVVNEDVSPTVAKVNYRMVDGTVRQMIIEIPYLAPEEDARAVLTLEISRHALLPPSDTSIFVVPDKPAREVRLYLGPSPLIESRSPKIKSLAKEITADRESAWAKVEAIYDWVRDNVEYKNGKLKGALAALRDKTGDCEELTSLFIAMCRANGIPARTVWVPGHCYPEFYLEDAEGQGHWFACQAAGTRDFGGITEHRPILQKGDSFRVPDKPRERQRYMAEFLTGTGGQPKAKFIRRPIDSAP